MKSRKYRGLKVYGEVEEIEVKDTEAETETQTVGSRRLSPRTRRRNPHELDFLEDVRHAHPRAGSPKKV